MKFKAQDQLDFNKHENLEAPTDESDKFKFKSGGVKGRFSNRKKNTGMKFKELNKTEAELKQDARDVLMMKEDMERSEKEA